MRCGGNGCFSPFGAGTKGFGNKGPESLKGVLTIGVLAAVTLGGDTHAAVFVKAGR